MSAADGKPYLVHHTRQPLAEDLAPDDGELAARVLDTLEAFREAVAATTAAGLVVAPRLTRPRGRAPRAQVPLAALVAEVEIYRRIL